MPLRINMKAGRTAGGGIGVGVMQASGNPWTVADALAQDLVGRGLADYVDPSRIDPQPIYVGAAAGRPSAVGTPIGAQIVLTDVGNASRWTSDGTIWIPVGGSVNLKAEGGTLAAPVSTTAGAGLPTYDPNPVKLPGGLAIRGRSLLVCHLELAQTGAAGGASNNVLIGNLGSVSDPVAADLNYTDTGQTSFYDLSINFDSNGFRVHRNAPFNGVVGSSTGYVFASGANVDNDLWLGTGSYSLAAGQNRLILQRRWTLFF